MGKEFYVLGPSDRKTMFCPQEIYTLETHKTVVLNLVSWFVDVVLFSDSFVVLMDTVACYPLVPRKHMH